MIGEKNSRVGYLFSGLKNVVKSPMRREDRIKDVTTESGSDKSADLIIRSVLSMDCYGEASFTECG